MTQKDYIENIDGAERRTISSAMEVREEGDKKYFIGTGILYNAIADLGFFSEEVLPGAADDVLQDDVRGLLNHDSNLVLGRTASGTMSLEATGTGVNYRIAYNPEDPDHISAYQKVKRGDISQSSFAFSVKDDKWETRNGKDHRIIVKIARLYDMSIVTYPAYQNTTVAARSIEGIKKEVEERSKSMNKELAEKRIETLRLEL
jgi:HK97 family phage prohead protease